MTDTLWRLLWALPLVLAVGTAVLLLLRRLLQPGAQSTQAVPRLRVCESLTLSDQTRAHLLEADGSTYLVIESTSQAVLQATPLQPAAPRRAAEGWTSPWIRRLRAVAAR